MRYNIHIYIHIHFVFFYISGCHEGSDTVFVLDSSGSVGFDNFNTIKNFVKQLIVDLDIEGGAARIGLVTYSSSVQTRFKLNTYSTRTDILDNIDNITYTDGTTNTALAIQVTSDQMFLQSAGDRATFRNVMVVFTDGGSDNFEQTLDEARKARLKGITVLVIAVTDWINYVEVREVASDPDEKNVFYVSDFSKINSIQTVLRNAICNGKS